MGIGNSTFVYSPDVRVLIADPTTGKQFDVSADIESFSVSRGTSRISTCTFTLSNKYQKYDRKLMRMARIVVFLKRTRWLQVFSGYLDTVPYETIVPGPITIEASCTLKILENTYWDPYDFNNRVLLPGVFSDSNDMTASEGQEDGGAGRGVMNVLTKIAKWNEERVFIQRIPQEFLYYAAALQNSAQLDPDAEAIDILNERLGTYVDSGGAPTETPAPGATIGVNELKQVMLDVGFPDNFDNLAKGIAVAWAESGLVLTTHNDVPPDDSYGLWQINYIGSLRAGRIKRYGQPEEMYDAHKVAIAALDLSNKGTDWPSNWSTANSQHGKPAAYLAHLDSVKDLLRHPEKETPGSSGSSSGGSGNPQTQDIALRTRGGNVKIDNITPGCMSMGQFIQNEADKRGFAFYVTSGTDGTHANNSWHYKGMALDIAGRQGNTADLDQLWGIVEPMAKQGAFVEAIYQHHGYEGSTPYNYKASDHYNHIHIANNQSEFMGHTYTAGGVDTVYGTSVGWSVSPDGIVIGNYSSPFTIAYKLYDDNVESHILTGQRAFLNDVKLLNTVSELCKASMREFQSGPNGDFVAWFPDWFGVWGKTPTMVIEDIELIDCKFSITDKALITHVGIAGATQGFDESVDLPEWLTTRGIVTIEQQELLKFILHISPSDKVVVESGDFLQTFGMRLMRESVGIIRSHAWEYTYALFAFMKQWTLQYRTPVNLTFMPELYPGMRIRLPDTARHKSVEMYIESVTHSGSRTGGFTTTIDVSCPMRNGALLGLELDSADVVPDYNNPTIKLGGFW